MFYCVLMHSLFPYYTFIFIIKYFCNFFSYRKRIVVKTYLCRTAPAKSNFLIRFIRSSQTWFIFTIIPMRIFTLLPVSLLVMLSVSLHAMPNTPRFSEISDRPDWEENIENPNLSLGDGLVVPLPDAKSAGKPSEELPPTWFVTLDVCGQGTGAIDLTPDPGTPGPHLFFWSNGETTEDVSGLTAGVYGVTVGDANGNVQMAQIIVGEAPFIGPLDITGVVTGNTICAGPGIGNGAIDITVTPDPTVFSYQWSNGATDMDIQDLEPGTYTVSVTFGVTCTTTETFVVPNLTNAPVLVPPILGFGYDYCNLSNGWATVGAQGGVPPYSYEWSNGGTTMTINDLPAGTYTVTVTGANGCTLEHTEVVPAADLDVSAEEVQITSNTTCNGANGSVTISLLPPGLWQNNASFEWSNGATTQNLTNVPSGSYRVTVTRAGTCTDVATFFVEDEPVLPDLAFTQTDATCGLSNGAINLTALPGGIAPYTYQWSNNATTEDLMNVPPGNYTVTLTSANGCTKVGSVDIADNEVLYSYSTTIQDNTSCDTINGRISLSLFPTNLAYTWSNGATTTNLSPLAPGDYTVTISAGGTCTSVETITVGNQVEYPSIPIKVDTATCGLNNGGLDLTINGGLSPFAIMWSTGDTSQDLTNLAADTFFVTVTSAVGCSNTNTVIVPNVNQPIAINEVVIDNISCALPNGLIDLNVSPADTNYVYTWSSGQTTDSLFNLTGGTYLVTVTLGVSCIALDTFSIIDQALPPDLSAAASPATCGFNNGSVDLTVNAGSPPYTFQWSTAGTDEDLSNMPPGAYSVTVTGANTCTAVSSVNISNTDLPLAVSGLPLENSSCATPNGSLNISVSPAGAYTYAWSNTATSEDLNGLSAGTYTVTVTFGTCNGSNSFTIADNAVAPGLATSGTAANCGLANGAADLSTTAGVAPFTYAWSTASTDEDISGLLPGTYTVTVTGANACTGVSTVTVQNNNITLNLNTATTANSSCTTFNGALDLSVTPAGTYSYQWSNAGNTEDLSGLDAGTYTVTVTLGTCQSTGTYIIDDNTQTPVVTPGITAAICSVNNGAIDLNVAGPSGPFTYLWSNAATDQNLSSLLPGTYTVTVSAPNGCTEVVSINVPNNSNTFSLAGTAAPLTNCASNNGAINLNITPAGSYTYLWSNAATDEDLSGLSPGTYTVSVTESGSCTATATFFVIDQRTNPVTSQSLTPELCGLADGAIDLSVSGGITPYAFFWSNAAATEDISNLGAGIYTVTVTDANNCTATSSAVIPGNSISFALSGNATANSSCIVNNGSVDLNVNPAGTYAYTWSNNTVSEDLLNVPAGTYTVTVSAGGNCTNTAVFNINSNVPTPSLSNLQVDATCGAANGSIDLTASGSPAPFSFLWSNTAVTEDLSNITAGTYTVTVTGGNGCTSSQAFVVQDDVFAPAIATSLTPATSCVVNNGAVNITVTPTGTYTFVWSNAAITEDLSNIAAGTYTVTVSAGGACTSTTSVTVTSNTPPPVLTNTPVAANCGLSTGSIDLTVSGSQTPYNFLWSNAAITEDLNSITGGTYTVTVTAGNGCTATQSITVNDNVFTPAIGSAITADNACGTGNGAVDLSVTPAGTYVYTWSNGANTEDVGNLNAGAYTVTVSAGGTCTNTAVFQVSDQAINPQVGITSTGTELNCDVASLLLTGTVSGTNNQVTLQWSLNGNPVGANTTLTASAPGQYILVVVDNVTACSATSSISLTQSLNPPPLSIATPALLTCTSQSQVLTGSSTLGGVQFSWLTITGTDTTVLGNGPTLNVNTPGNYVLVGFNPANNCFNAIPVNVQANQIPPGAEAGPSFTLDCAGETLPLSGSGSGGVNLGFQWSTQDGNIVSGANSAAPLINEAGTYTLTVTNPLNGCTASDNVIIEPEVPVAHVSVVQPTCQNLKGTIMVDSVTGLSNPILYSLNGGALSNQSQFGNLDPGTYTLAVEGGNGCTATAVITISAAELVSITLDAEADIRLGYGHLINALVNVPANELASATWTPSDSLSCDTCLTTFASPVTSTRYQLHVVSEDGCEARSSILIRVDKTRHIYAPNIFSPDDDGNNDFFTLYADPVQVARIKALRVYSRWGEEMYERLDFSPNEYQGWDGNFKGQKLNPAVFVWQAVVEFIDGQEELFTGDVTLQR